MRDLIHLKDQSHLSLCSTIGLINAHRRCETLGNTRHLYTHWLRNRFTWISECSVFSDEEALYELTSDLKLSGSTAGDRALYYAALLYWILDRNIKARNCINKMLKLSDKSPQVCVTDG